MKERATIIESLFEKSEAYIKTNIDLFKLKATNVTADVVSTILSKLVVFIVVFLIILTVNIGLALWVGELVGKLYLGFFIVAGFYVLVALLLYFVPGIIKTPVNNAIILKIINIKKEENENTK